MSRLSSLFIPAQRRHSPPAEQHQLILKPGSRVFTEEVLPQEVLEARKPTQFSNPSVSTLLRLLEQYQGRANALLRRSSLTLDELEEYRELRKDCAQFEVMASQKTIRTSRESHVARLSPHGTGEKRLRVRTCYAALSTSMLRIANKFDIPQMSAQEVEACAQEAGFREKPFSEIQSTDRLVGASTPATGTRDAVQYHPPKPPKERKSKTSTGSALPLPPSPLFNNPENAAPSPTNDPFLQRYQLGETILGSGTYGVVVEARDLDGTAGDVVIKIERSPQGSKTESSLINETNIAKYCQDPDSFTRVLDSNVVRCSALPKHCRPPGASANTPVHLLVMKRERGGDLSDKLHALQTGDTPASQRCTNEELRYLLGRLILALENLHARKILHLDLTPANILLSENSLPKLADFGNSVDFTEKLPKDVWMTTWEYKAPEAWTHPPPRNREDLWQKLDWWSLGVIAYQMATGHRPFGLSEYREDENILRKRYYAYLQENWWRFGGGEYTIAELDLRADETRRFTREHGRAPTREELDQAVTDVIHATGEPWKYYLIPANDVADIRRYLRTELRREYCASRVTEGTPLVRPPEITDDNLWDLLVKMLRRDPEQRLSADELKHHPFFAISNNRQRVSAEKFFRRLAANAIEVPERLRDDATDGVA